MIKYLGNRRFRIANLFEKTNKILKAEKKDWLWVTDSTMEKNEFFKFAKVVESLFTPFLEEFKHNKLEYGSFFTKLTKDSRCSAWHRDIGNGKFYGMLMSSFPNPTYILDTKKLKNVDFGHCSDDYDNDEMVNDLIKQEKAKIIIPKPGDIYFLSGDVIHKPNPKSLKVPHMCLRVWLHNQRK